MKVSLLNFAITFSGLEDQILGVTVVQGDQTWRRRCDAEKKRDVLVSYVHFLSFFLPSFLLKALHFFICPINRTLW